MKISTYREHLHVFVSSNKIGGADNRPKISGCHIGRLLAAGNEFDCGRHLLVEMDRSALSRPESIGEDGYSIRHVRHADKDMFLYSAGAKKSGVY